MTRQRFLRIVDIAFYALSLRMHRPCRLVIPAAASEGFDAVHTLGQDLHTGLAHRAR